MWILILVLTTLSGDNLHIKSVNVAMHQTGTREQCERLAVEVRRAAKHVSHAVDMDHTCVPRYKRD